MTPIRRTTTTYAGTHNSQYPDRQTTDTRRLFVTVAIVSLLTCLPGVSHSQATPAKTTHSETRNAVLAYLNAPRAIAPAGKNAQNEAASAQTVADDDAIHKRAVQEGFPVAQLQRLKNRDAALRAQSRGSFAAIQAVISPLKVWSEKELPLKVAFLGGSDELRGQIVSAVAAWSAGSGIRFDFGAPGAYREWTRHDQVYKAEVRIAFDEGGYWSFVGADSIDTSVAGPNEASMSFQDFATALPANWQGVVRHEFGHAIGFQHEHQSPVSGCDRQFRWNDDLGYVSTTDVYGQFVQDPQGMRPGIYTVLGGPPNGWQKTQIDANLRQLPVTIDIRYTTFDPKSVMMYSFADWMFVDGAQSKCYTAENLTPSFIDLQTAAIPYPLTTTPIISPAALRAGRALAASHKLPAQVQEQLTRRLAQFQ